MVRGSGIGCCCSVLRRRRGRLGLGETFSVVYSLVVVVVLSPILVVLDIVVGLSSGKPILFGRIHIAACKEGFGV